MSGWLAGVRIRKNFKTREDAAAEKAALDIRALQLTGGARRATTFLTDDQLRDAEAAFRRIADRPHGLGFYLDFALANYREPERLQKLDVAVSEYVDAKRREHARDLLSLRQLRSISRELSCLQRYFPKVPVSHFTPPVLATYLERGHAAPKTFNNRRGIVGAFLKFSLQRDWIESNPLDKLSHRRIGHRRGSAATITRGTSTNYSYRRDYDYETTSNRLVKLVHRSLYGSVNDAKQVETRLIYDNRGLRDTEMTKGTDFMRALGQAGNPFQTANGFCNDFNVTDRCEINQRQQFNLTTGWATTGTAIPTAARTYTFDPIGNRMTDQAGP